ncbi:hypothetical protein [Myceligenerans halotolerans]
MTLDHDSVTDVLVFVMDPITIEVQFEWREVIVDVLLCRTVGGRRPPGWYAHGGKKMRVLLWQALKEGPDEYQGLASRLASDLDTRARPAEEMLRELRVQSAIVSEIMPLRDRYFDALFGS